MNGVTVRAFLAVGVVVAGLLLAGPWLAVILAIASLPFVIRTQDGRLWADALITRLRFRAAELRKQTTFVGPGAPGSLARLKIVRCQPFAVLADGDHFCVVLDADAQGTWRGLLATDPLLERVTVSSHCGAALPGRLVLSPGAPAVAQEIAIEAAPPSALLPDSWVCLSWRVADTQSALAHIDEAMTTIGATALTGQDVAAVVSIAYRPDGAPAVDLDHAGPTQATEFWNHYVHDDQASVVWRVLNTCDVAGLLLRTVPCSIARVSTSYTREPRSAALRQSTVITITGPTGHSDDLARAAAAVRARAAAQGVRLSPAVGAMAACFATGIGVGASV